MSVRKKILVSLIILVAVFVFTIVIHDSFLTYRLYQRSLLAQESITKIKQEANNKNWRAVGIILYKIDEHKKIIKKDFNSLISLKYVPGLKQYREIGSDFFQAAENLIFVGKTSLALQEKFSLLLDDKTYSDLNSDDKEKILNTIMDNERQIQDIAFYLRAGSSQLKGLTNKKIPNNFSIFYF